MSLIVPSSPGDFCYPFCGRHILAELPSSKEPLQVLIVLFTLLVSKRTGVRVLSGAFFAPVLLLSRKFSFSGILVGTANSQGWLGAIALSNRDLSWWLNAIRLRGDFLEGMGWFSKIGDSIKVEVLIDWCDNSCFGNEELVNF